jgi:hypothetical protein
MFHNELPSINYFGFCLAFFPTTHKYALLNSSLKENSHSTLTNTVFHSMAISQSAGSPDLGLAILMANIVKQITQAMLSSMQVKSFHRQLA